jgi:hypothetical protein
LLLLGDRRIDHKGHRNKWSKSMTRRLLALLGTAVAACAVSTPASAANIILTDPTGSFAAAGAKGQLALTAFRKAANYWNTVLTNNVTINIEIGFASLGAGVLGSTGSSSTGASVSNVYSRLRATGNSSLDAAATANLFPLNADGSLRFRTNAARFSNGSGALTNTTFLDNNSSTNNKILDVNTANARALGLAVDGSNQCSTRVTNVDACITFSNTFNFDFDPTNGITAGAFDFVGVATHEIGHALGFVSGVDTYDFVAANSTTDNLNNFRIFSVLDLFRYGTTVDPATGRVNLQLAANRDARFSIDGSTTFNAGRTDVSGAIFSTGSAIGDGQQASHFKDVASGVRQIGIMDPTIGPGQLALVTSNDIAAFDAIGYNVNFNVLNNRGYSFSTAQIFNLAGLAGIGLRSLNGTAFDGGLNITSVPEPATWAMMLIGFGFAGSAMRRRRHNIQITYA